MQRITDPSAASSLPASISTGSPGFFTNGNPTVGIAATIFTQDWGNGVQEELIAILTKAGVTPSIATNSQILAALTTMFSSAPLYITASQNVIVPAWSTRVFQRLWGGGASGACGPTSSYRGGGGGSGGYIECVQTGLVSGSTMTITIGQGGAAVSSGNGNSGGSTSTGGGATATGGGGGGGSNLFAGGAGGGGAIANGITTGIIFGGMDGGDGNSSAPLPGGNGGGPFGGRGATGNAFNGIGPGGGGGGCPSGYVSGAGANGAVILQFLP